MRYDMPLLGRLFTKLIFDVVPAALASLIGGFLLTHYGLVRAPEPAAQAAPASAEMMQLLRDEHGLMVNFLKARIENEKRQIAAENAASGIASEAESPAALTAPRRVAVAMAAAKPTAPRSKAPIVGASLPPLAIAQGQQSDSVNSVAPDHDSLLAKTIGIKDHVVAVTHRVVSAIGGIPSWIGSIGDRIGGEDASPRPPSGLISAS
jgi:hypothetical protein